MDLQTKFYKRIIDPRLYIDVSLDEIIAGCTKHIDYNRNYGCHVKPYDAEVKIPKGTKNNEAIVLQNKGNYNPGLLLFSDLEVVVKYKDNPDYTVVGNNIYRTVEITESEALNGFCKKIEYIDNSTIHIAKQGKSNQNDIITYSGIGLNGGNLIIKLHIQSASQQDTKYIDSILDEIFKHSHRPQQIYSTKKYEPVNIANNVYRFIDTEIDNHSFDKKSTDNLLHSCDEITNYGSFSGKEEGSECQDDITQYIYNTTDICYDTSHTIDPDVLINKNGTDSEQDNDSMPNLAKISDTDDVDRYSLYPESLDRANDTHETDYDTTSYYSSDPYSPSHKQSVQDVNNNDILDSEDDDDIKTVDDGDTKTVDVGVILESEDNGDIKTVYDNVILDSEDDYDTKTVYDNVILDSEDEQNAQTVCSDSVNNEDDIFDSEDAIFDSEDEDTHVVDALDIDVIFDSENNSKKDTEDNIIEYITIFNEDEGAEETEDEGAEETEDEGAEETRESTKTDDDCDDNYVDEYADYYERSSIKTDDYYDDNYVDEYADYYDCKYDRDDYEDYTDITDKICSSEETANTVIDNNICEDSVNEFDKIMRECVEAIQRLEEQATDYVIDSHETVPPIDTVEQDVLYDNCITQTNTIASDDEDKLCADIESDTDHIEQSRDLNSNEQTDIDTIDMHNNNVVLAVPNTVVDYTDSDYEIFEAVADEKPVSTGYFSYITNLFY